MHTQTSFKLFLAICVTQIKKFCFLPIEIKYYICMVESLRTVISNKNYNKKYYLAMEKEKT